MQWETPALCIGHAGSYDERTIHAVIVPFALVPAAIREALPAPPAALVLGKHATKFGAVFV